jgi:lipopolysaccharide transport system ATP-binding protein
MSDFVTKVENLSKLYRLGQVGTGSLAHDVNRWWHRVRGKEDPYSQVGQVNDRSKKSASEYVYALKDINFEVKQGEVLGIIGRNGAGKSTLLKILSRVTGPTSGEVKIKGRIAALLEVGTGFHPDLTGRENLFLNGAILGMTKAEICSKLDEIVDFSGCEAYLDTPVKRYSSGMQVRLAFAVAAHLEPEILIVDEVLAVGDAEFQKKCLGRMGQVSREGRTILFVSHNMVAVQSLCTRAIHLEEGKVIADGMVRQIVSSYLKQGGAVESERSWPDLANAPGNDQVRIARITVQAVEPMEDGLITMLTPVRFAIEYARLKSGGRVHFTFHLINEEEVVVLTTSPGGCPLDLGIYRTECSVPGSLLNSGGYRLRLLVVEDGSRVTSVDESIVSFSVIDTRERDSGWMGREPSAVQISLKWNSLRIDCHQAAVGLVSIGS